MTDSRTEPTVNVVFTWQTFMPDHRQFKQNSIVLTPQETFVVVNVPIKPEYLANFEKMIVNGLYANPGKPILTPLGMRYVMDQLESVVLDVPLNNSDFTPETDDEFGSDAESGDEFETVEDDEDDEWK